MLVIKQHGIEMDMAEYSLREIKHARTKIALMKAFIEHLRHSSFEDISVKDACKRAEISEGTFFNYFPGKIDYLLYQSYDHQAPLEGAAKRC